VGERIECAGIYLEDVTAATENAYPTDGKHTDGYWYKKEGVNYTWKQYNIGTHTTWSRLNTTDEPLVTMERINNQAYIGSADASSPSELTKTDDYNLGGTYVWVYENGNYYYGKASWESDYKCYWIFPTAMLKQVSEQCAGTYVKTVTSTNANAYPANGRYTDGYWYIRQ